MPAIALRRRTHEHVDELVRKDFERYRGHIILVHYAVDHRRLGHVNVSFVPPLLARISPKASIVEWDLTRTFCDVSYEIVPLDLRHTDLAGMEWLHVNAPGRAIDPTMDEYWQNHWELAKRTYGLFGEWKAIPRNEAAVCLSRSIGDRQI